MYNQYPGYAGQPPLAPKHSGMASASMTLAIIGVFIGWCTFGAPSIIAVILGIAGYAETSNGRMTGRGQAVAGIIVGALVGIPTVMFFLIGALTQMNR